MPAILIFVAICGAAGFGAFAWLTGRARPRIVLVFWLAALGDAILAWLFLPGLVEAEDPGALRSLIGLGSAAFLIAGGAVAWMDAAARRGRE